MCEAGEANSMGIRWWWLVNVETVKSTSQAVRGCAERSHGALRAGFSDLEAGFVGLAVGGEVGERTETGGGQQEQWTSSDSKL